MKPKSNRKGNNDIDKCQTPPYALFPLLPYLPKNQTILDPCAGKGVLLATLMANGLDALGQEYEMREDVGSIPLPEEMLTSKRIHGYFHHLSRSRKFIQHAINFLQTNRVFADLIVTNPPYSIKLEFLEHILRLEKPWALLMPAEFMFTGGFRALTPLFHAPLKMICMAPRVNFAMPDFSWSGSENKPYMLSYWRQVRRELWADDPKKAKWLEDPKKMNATPSAQFPVAWYTCGILPESAPQLQWVDTPKAPFFQMTPEATHV